MSKELEALKNIKREAGVPYFSTLYDIDMWREDFATVEAALKALEIITECFGVNLILFTAEKFGLPEEKIDLLKRFYAQRIDAA